MPILKTIKAKWYSLIFTLCLLNPSDSHAQNQNYFFDVTGGVGRLISHHPLLDPLEGPVSFFNARWGIKTTGKKDWQRTFNYPTIGLGVFHNQLTQSYLGNPTAAYTFMYLPFFEVAKIKFNLGIHLGLAWGIHPYSVQNPLNVALGSMCAAYASLNLNTTFTLTSNIDLYLCAGGYHYSNGNTTKPNKGLNQLGTEGGLRYRLTSSNIQFNKNPVKPVERKGSVMIFGAYGWKKEVTDGSFYNTGSLSTGYYLTINNKSRLSTGGDLFYDEGVLYFSQKENKLKNVIASGLFAGHELTLSQFSIVTQIGIYLNNPHPADPFYYERLGMRYIISNRVIPSLTLKAHEFKIDFIEWGIGIVLWKTK
ncbi:MAG: acyloxyacyl hydrolase [Mariniphaga sp.]